MNVAKQLPDVLICSPITEKRIVVQIDFLLPNLYEHLHCNMLKSTNEPLTDILQVVVAEYQIDLTVKPIQYLCPFGSTTQTEITQVKYRIIGSYGAVPVRYQDLIHLLYILERTIAKAYDIRMVEMRIGCKERMFCIKLEIHCFFLL